MRFIILGSLLLTVTWVSGQQIKITTLPLTQVTYESVDRLGNFYFVLPNGKLRKYDIDGNLMDETKPSVTPLTLLEPWNPLKVFIYSKTRGEYTFLDHHLEVIETKKLDPSLSINPHLVCPANEANRAWILDAADMTLKRVNLLSNLIELEAPIDGDWGDDIDDIVFMREYQNRLLILNREKGIMIFNNLAIPVTSIDVSGLNFFNFVGEELCYLKGNGELVLLDLYTGAKRKLTVLGEADIQSTIVTDERMVVVRRQGVDIYQLK